MQALRRMAIEIFVWCEKSKSWTSSIIKPWPLNVLSINSSFPPNLFISIQKYVVRIHYGDYITFYTVGIFWKERQFQGSLRGGNAGAIMAGKNNLGTRPAYCYVLKHYFL